MCSCVWPPSRNVAETSVRAVACGCSLSIFSVVQSSVASPCPLVYPFSRGGSRASPGLGCLSSAAVCAVSRVPRWTRARPSVGHVRTSRIVGSGQVLFTSGKSHQTDFQSHCANHVPTSRREERVRSPYSASSPALDWLLHFSHSYKWLFSSF